ncbi:hypothetical protein BH11BAC2_BH11BAC2_00400 [soil metagenome]
MNLKVAETRYPIHDLIRNRWSARSFAPDPITPEKMNQLFEAASWAFSSMNDQPWRYYYAFKGEKAFDDMLDCLLPSNAIWAQHAAVLILSGAVTRFANGNENRYAAHDVGAANTNLLLEATAENIYGHVLGGYDPDKTAALFPLHEGEIHLAFIALGYQGNPEDLSEPFKTREISKRSRKELKDFAFHYSK